MRPRLATPHRATCHCDGTAKHWFCKTRGIYAPHRRRSTPNNHGANAACLDGVHPHDLDPVQWTDSSDHPSERQ